MIQYLGRSCTKNSWVLVSLQNYSTGLGLSQTSKFGDSFSKSFNFQIRLPQGAVSSCSLFNIFVNDLLSSLNLIPSIKCLLFAADLVIWTQALKNVAIKLIECCLNNALHMLSNWCEENNVTVNLEQTASQSFSLTHEAFRPRLIN